MAERNTAYSPVGSQELDMTGKKAHTHSTCSTAELVLAVNSETTGLTQLFNHIDSLFYFEHPHINQFYSVSQ